MCIESLRLFYQIIFKAYYGRSSDLFLVNSVILETGKWKLNPSTTLCCELCCCCCCFPGYISYPIQPTWSKSRRMFLLPVSKNHGLSQGKNVCAVCRNFWTLCQYSSLQVESHWVLEEKLLLTCFEPKINVMTVSAEAPKHDWTLVKL